MPADVTAEAETLLPLAEHGDRVAADRLRELFPLLEHQEGCKKGVMCFCLKTEIALLLEDFKEEA